MLIAETEIQTQWQFAVQTNPDHRESKTLI